MAWQYILTDLYGNVHGEITQASGRTLTLPHLRVPSASFTMPLWHPLAGLITDTDCLLKCYRTDPVTAQRTLAFHGPIISTEEVAEAGVQNIAVTAASPFWRLTKRLIPSSISRTGYSYGSPTALGDLGTIATSIIQDTNAATGGFTGIDPSTAAGAQHTDSVSGWVDRWYSKNVAEAIAELAAGLSSFEFRVRPTEPAGYANTPYNWPRIGLFDRAPVIGQSRPDAVFEYGTSRANVLSYSRTKSRDGLLTRGHVSVSGWPDTIQKTINVPPAPDANTPVDLYHWVTRDSDQITARGLFEEVLNDAGILDDTLRTNIADYHLLLRKQPREGITFKPAINARPAPFVDYDVGDTIRARAIVRGTLRFDALFRIWGITFNVDENGNESVDLELVQP